MHGPIRFSSENEKGPKYLLIRPHPLYFDTLSRQLFIKNIFIGKKVILCKKIDSEKHSKKPISDLNSSFLLVKLFATY